MHTRFDATAQHPCFAPAPWNTVDLLAGELRELGAGNVRAARGGAAFTGDLAVIYRVCLWSRVASRVLLQLGTWTVATPEMLYAAAASIDWETHVRPTGTLAVSCTGLRPAIANTHYAALKVKDAIVDQFRGRHGTRPSVDVETPDLQIDVHLRGQTATISIDLSGPPLHRRGYRKETVEAPLKENLAAAVLLRAGWPQLAMQGGQLADPMCGSGTLLIEGAWLGGDGAPGMLRPRFGFTRWIPHDPQLWTSLTKEAQARWQAGRVRLAAIIGADMDRRAVLAARENIEAAGMTGLIEIEQRSVGSGHAPSVSGSGLVVTNPPYGARLGHRYEVGKLYGQLGAHLRSTFAGWRAAVLVGRPDLAARLGSVPSRSHDLRNGPIRCRLDITDLPARGAQRLPDGGAGDVGAVSEVMPKPSAPAVRSAETGSEAERGRRTASGGPAVVAAEGGQMFANRLRKNLRIVGKWARKNGISCYRLYDADMPEYSVALDVYQSEALHVNVQEYRAPDSVDADRAAARLAQALAAIPQVLDVDSAHIHVKTRRRQRGAAQYEKLSSRGELHEVREGPCRLLVNFSDHLDTGLFLDHRITRQMIGELAAGRTLLNLFAYTGTATVHAAVAGARSSTSVDMSRTYLDWARRNLCVNGHAAGAHKLIRADCLTWLREEHAERYAVVFLDPPTFSNSTRMAGTFDVQRDHAWLVRRAAALLEPDGVLMFANNYRRFRIAADELYGLEVEDVTAGTIPRDFQRSRRIHNCWRITRRPS